MARFIIKHLAAYSTIVQRRSISLSSLAMQNERSGGPITMAYNSYEATTTPETNANPVVIMHGLFGSKQNWRSICKALHSKSIPCRKVSDIQHLSLNVPGHNSKSFKILFVAAIDCRSGRSQSRWKRSFSKPFVRRYSRWYGRILSTARHQKGNRIGPQHGRTRDDGFCIKIRKYLPAHLKLYRFNHLLIDYSLNWWSRQYLWTFHRSRQVLLCIPCLTYSKRCARLMYQKN